MKKILTIDIGGSAIKYGLCHKQTILSEKGQIPTPQESIKDLVDALCRIASKFPNTQGMAISMPGKIDTEKGYVYHAGLLTYLTKCAFAEMLQTRTGCPVVLQNDAKCATLAELMYGNLQDCSSGIALILGSGVGGGIVINHKVLLGAHLTAGEFSFIQTNSESDTFDFQNLVGAHCGRTALSEYVYASSGIANLNGKEIFKLLKDGHKEVLPGIQTYCLKIVNLMYNLQMIFDPERIVIGGGISAEPLFIDILKDTLKNYYAAIPFVDDYPEVMACCFHNDANLIGAACTYQIYRNM